MFSAQLFANPYEGLGYDPTVNTTLIERAKILLNMTDIYSKDIIDKFQEDNNLTVLHVASVFNLTKSVKLILDSELVDVTRKQSLYSM